MGKVVFKRRDGNRAGGEGSDITRCSGRWWWWIVCRPVVVSPSRINASLKGLAVPGDTHWHHAYFRPAREGCRGNIDVKQTAGWRLAEQQPLDQAGGDAGGPLVISMVIPLEGNGDAGDPEKGPLDGRSNGPGIEHIDSRIQPTVNATDDQIRSGRAELRDTKLHGISWTAIDRPAPSPGALKDLFCRQWREKGNGMTNTTLLGRRSNHGRLKPPIQSLLEGRQAWGVDAIIVGQ